MYREGHHRRALNTDSRKQHSVVCLVKPAAYGIRLPSGDTITRQTNAAKSGAKRSRCRRTKLLRQVDRHHGEGCITMRSWRRGAFGAFNHLNLLRRRLACLRGASHFHPLHGSSRLSASKLSPRLFLAHYSAPGLARQAIYLRPSNADLHSAQLRWSECCGC